VFFLLVYSFVTRATEFDGVQSITGDSATPNALTSMGNNALAVKTGKHLLNAGAAGSLSYSVGIDLPPALLKPVLSVDYTSGAGQDFEVAYGWRISGIQSISLAKEPYFRQQSQRDGEDIFRAAGVIGGILHDVDATQHVF
jgi:hypothetical protein